MSTISEFLVLANSLTFVELARGSVALSVLPFQNPTFSSPLLQASLTSIFCDPMGDISGVWGLLWQPMVSISDETETRSFSEQ
jgi:hypothetical protein